MLLVGLVLIRYRTLSSTVFLSASLCQQIDNAKQWLCEISLSTRTVGYNQSHVLGHRLLLSLSSIPFLLPLTFTLTVTQIWVSCTFSLEPLLKSRGSFWPLPIRPFRELWRPNWGRGTGEGRVPPVGVPPLVDVGTWEQDMDMFWEQGDGLLLLLRPTPEPVPTPKPIMLLLKWWVL